MQTCHLKIANKEAVYQLLPLNAELVPGFELSQVAHFTASALFCTRQTAESQLPSGFLNLSTSWQPPEVGDSGTVLLLEFEVGVARPKKQGGNTGKFSFTLCPYLSDTTKCTCSIFIHDSGSDRANARILNTTLSKTQ